MTESLIDNSWTDEVCEAWLHDANTRFEGFRNNGGTLVEAVAIMRDSIPPAVMEYLDREFEDRNQRMAEILANAEGSPVSVLDAAIELGDLKIVDIDD